MTNSFVSRYWTRCWPVLIVVIFIGQFQSLLNENLDYLILFNKLLQQQMIIDDLSPPPIIGDEIELLS